MSTILKALRRLENEKTPESGSRPLREELADAPTSAPEPSSRSGAWIPMLSLVLGLAIGASALWMWPRGSQTPDVAMGAAPEKSVPTPALPAPIAPRVRTEPRAAFDAPKKPAPVFESGAADPIDSNSVAVVPRPPREPRIAEIPPSSAPVVVTAPTAANSARALLPKESAPPKRETLPKQATRLASAKPALTESKPVAPPDASPPRKARTVSQDSLPIAKSYPIEREIPPTPSVAAPVESVLAATQTPEPADVTPVRAEPAPRVAKAPVPPAAKPSPLRVAKTFWHPTRDRREAMIAVGDGDPARLHEGDIVGGYVVAEIQPAAVLFERDGERIRRALGER